MFESNGFTLSPLVGGKPSTKDFATASILKRFSGSPIPGNVPTKSAWIAYSSLKD
ncbi:hypothetical protein FHW88_006125 [Mucilaginibacter sp. SG538B]|nr:hypothetical protein [Mucilaginibacter sp. SG538B]